MTAAILCPSRDELHKLLDGSLSESRTDELAAHVELCALCRREIDRLAAGGDWPEQVAKHLSSPGRGDNGESIDAQRLAERWRKRPTETDAESGSFSDGLERLAFLEPSDEPGVLGTLGPYEITETIGRGGFGLVLKGRDPRLNRVVAVKVLAPEWASNATARKRFLREAQAAAAIRHDHVVTIYAVDEVGQLPYLVMEFVPGKSLQERIDEQGPLDIREILRIGRQIAVGLAAAHAEGLIHRDIKPGNVLLEDGIQRVKITDFGLARAVDDVGMTQTGTVAGTPEYMSPEQAWGGPVDHRTDLFSLGCVLYAMCTGRSPFRANSAMAVLRRVCEDEPRPIHEVNPEVPRPLAAVIERLLAKDPEDRYASAHEVADLLAAQLASIQNAETIHLPPELSPDDAYVPNAALGTWTWIAESFQRANRWGRGIDWGNERRGAGAIENPPPHRLDRSERRIRWGFVAIVVWGAPTVALLLIWLYLAVSENWSHGPTAIAELETANDPGISTMPPVEELPWSPRLEATNELTLDIRDPAVQITIDGQPYPVDEPGKRRVRLGKGVHEITAGDERGEFDEETIHTPTPESYLRIDRDGILRSSVPTNVQVRWIQAESDVSDLHFKGTDDVLIGRDNIGQGRDSIGQERLMAWDIDSGQGMAAPADNESSMGWRGPGFDMSALGMGNMGGMAGSSPMGPPRNPAEDAPPMAVTEDGNFLAARGDGNSRQVRLYDVADPNPSNWTRQMVVTQHPDSIDEIAFSPDGRLLLCASDGRCEVFRLDGLIATEIGRIDQDAVTIAAFLPDNRRVLIGDKDGNLELWDAKALRREAAYPRGDKFDWTAFQSIDIDRAGRRALLNCGEKIFVLDLEAGEVVSKPGWSGEESVQIRSARFLPDGRHCALVVTDRDGGHPELQIGEIEIGRITARLNLGEAVRAGTGDPRVHDLRFSPDGRRVTAACEVPLHTATVHRPEQRQANGHEFTVLHPVKVQVGAIAVVTWTVPDDAFETAAPQDADKDGIKLIETIKTPGPVASLDFTPDGTQFVSGGEDGGGAVRTFPDGDVVHRLSADPNASHIAVSPDGKRIAEAHGATLTLWDRETGKRLLDTKLTATVQVQDQDVYLVPIIKSIAWSPDGGSLVIACPRPYYSQGELVRRLPTGHAFLVRLDGETATIERRFQHPGDVRAAMFLGDGSRIVTACVDSGVRIWSAETGKLLQHHDNSGRGWADALDATSDGRRAGIGRGRRGGACSADALDATSDGGYIVAGLSDGSIRVWETRYGRPVLRLDRGHPITAVRFLPDETRLVAADDIGVVMLWDLGSASIVAREITESTITALAVHPDGEHVLTAGSSSTSPNIIKLWRLPKAAD